MRMCPEYASHSAKKHRYTNKKLWADILRQEVVSTLNSECSHLELNAKKYPFLLDKGVGVKYASMKRRLTKMTHAFEYAGNLEIMTATYILKFPICIYEDRGNDLMRYSSNTNRSL